MDRRHSLREHRPPRKVKITIELDLTDPDPQRLLQQLMEKIQDITRAVRKEANHDADAS